MRPDDLERAVGERLRALPAPRAPRTLLPRVLSAVEQLALRPWYARPWRGWPIQWQIASLAGILVVVAAGSLLVPAIQHAVQPYTDAAGRLFFARVGTPLAALAAAARGGETIWRAVVAPAAAVAMVPLAALCAATLVFGAALGRLGMGGSLRS